MMLIIVSMGAMADVKVLFGEKGTELQPAKDGTITLAQKELTGGTIIISQVEQKDGQVAVTFTIKPDNGYTFTYTKTSLVIVSVYDPSSKSGTRADEVKVSEPLSVKGTEGTIRYPNYGEYTVTVDPNLGIWVQTVVFSESGAKVDPPVTPTNDYSGKYYIASDAIVNGAPIYNANTPANNYYLCPADGWCYYKATNNFDADGTTYPYPFLTTFKWRDGVNDNKVIWIIEKCPNTNYSNYYYIKQHIEGNRYKYLMLNGQISGTSNKNRMRVHLEEHVEDTDNPTLNALFSITLASSANTSSLANEKSVIITPKNTESEDGKCKYLVVNGGNTDALTGQSGKVNGPGDTGEKYQWTQGIIGLYYDDNGKQDANAPFYLENNPTITYSNKKIRITYFDYADDEVEIRYTYDGTQPTASSKLYEGEFDPADGVTTIKAIAIKDEKVSGVATFSPPFFLGSTHNYLIQSKNCKFYNMIPNVSVDDNTKYVSTLNVPCSTMAWHFEDAEEGYYYIVDANGWYMYYTTTENTNKYIYLKSNKDDSDGFKFKIASHKNGGYNIIPKGSEKAIYKNIFGNNNAGLIPVKFDGTITEAVARWDIIPYSNLTQWDDQPFTKSTDNDTKYYKIVSVREPTKPLILAKNENNEEVIMSTTLPESDYDNRKSMWVIKKVGTDTDGLLDYYTFQNAYTGEMLYLNKKNKEVKTDTSPGMLQMGQPTADGADATWSHFVIVQTTNNGYNIIPRVLVDNTKAISTSTTHEGFNCINRANGKEYTGTWYDNDDGSRWTFDLQENVKCMNPVFTEETDGSITITSVTNAAVIRYTDNGNNPDANSGVYTTKSNTSSQRVIKAIAIIGTDANTASDIVTLLNKPDITLTEGGNTVTDETYTYDGTAKEPVVSEVSIGEAPNKTSATAGTDYETVESTDYSDNTNASTDAVKAKVTLRDKASNIFVWHAEKEFKINPKEVGLTWNPDDSGQTTFTYSGLAQAPTVTATGVVGTDVCTVTVTVTADEGWSLKGGEAVNYGNYTATASPLENKNYKLPDAKTRAFTITRAPVTVTADNKTKGYGDPEPEWTATVTGMVNNENPNLITYTVSCDHVDENGTYDIIPSGVAEQGNYTVTYVKGTLTINAIKPLNKDDAGTPADGITIDVTYNGTAYQVVVKHRKVENDYVLVQGNDKDYTWSVASNTDPNHPEYDVVTVTGHGNYTGDAKAIYIRLTFYDTTPNNDTDGPETAAAYYATQNLQLSGGIEAWYVTNLENNTLTFEKVKVVEGENEISYLPENQPVLLFGDPSSTGFMLKPYTGTIMEIPATGEGSNILKLVTENAGKAVNLGEVYVFSKGEFVLTMAGTLTKGKVYLDNPSYNSSSLSRGTLSASRGGTTGINDVRLSKTNDQFNNVWYALDGQKFNKKPTRKGIYLQNGKKVVIK